MTEKDVLMKLTFKRLLMIQILSSLATFIGPMVDGIIISDFLGPAYMAAFGIITPIAILTGAVTNIFNAGSQNAAGKYLGQGKADRINGLLTATVLWGAGTGIVFTSVLLLFGRSVLALLGAEGETMEMCMDYLSTFAFSIIPMLIMPSLVGFLQMDNGGKTAVTASCVMTAADVILDLLAVFVFKNGMKGIGLATTVSDILAVLVIFTHFLRKDTNLRFTFRDSLVRDIPKVVTCGLPAAAFLLFNAIRVSAANKIILSVSDLTALAAASIQNTFRPAVMGFTMGAGITALLVCSVISGEENRHAMRKELAYILKLGTGIALALTAAVLVLARFPFAALFCIGQPEEFTGLVAKVIRLFALSIPFSMVNFIFTYYYQSIRRFLLSAAICFLQNVVYYIGSIKILSGIMGIDGVWLGYLVSEILTLLTIGIIVWVKVGHFPKSVHDFLLLPDDFGVVAENRMNVTAVSIEQATEISAKITEFCKARGIDSRRTMIAGLCMEELAVIALKNCRAPRAYVDIYLTCKNGELAIRMRDNSRPFDSSLLSGIPEEEDPCANVGVRIVLGMAKEITYNVVLGMNMFSMVI